MRKCPKCGAPVPEDAKVCQVCGAVLEEPDMKHTMFWNPSQGGEPPGGAPGQPQQPQQPAQEGGKKTMFWAPGAPPPGAPTPQQPQQPPQPQQPAQEGGKKTMFWAPGAPPPGAPTPQQQPQQPPQPQQPQQPGPAPTGSPEKHTMFWNPSSPPDAGAPGAPPSQPGMQGAPSTPPPPQEVQPPQQGPSIPMAPPPGTPPSGPAAPSSSMAPSIGPDLDGATLGTKLSGSGLLGLLVMLGLVAIVLGVISIFIPFIGILLLLLGFAPAVPFILGDYIVQKGYIRGRDGQKHSFDWNVPWSKYWLGSMGRILLTGITAGIYKPWYVSWIYKMLLKKSKVDVAGTKGKFSYNGDGGGLFIPLWLGPVIVMAITFLIPKMFMSTPDVQHVSDPAQVVSVILGSVGILIFINSLVSLFTDAYFLNMGWEYVASKTKLTVEDGRTYKLKYKGSFMDIVLINLIGGILTAITLGIYAPWWMVKLINYLFKNTKMSRVS